MTCEECREAISAQLDREDPPGGAAGAARMDEHLATCAACAAFLDGAAQVTRLARTRPAEDLTDLTPGLLGAWDDLARTAGGSAEPAEDEDRGRPTRRRRRDMDLVCGGLVGVGLGQLGLAVAGVVSGSDSDGHAVEMAGSSMAHFSHESAAWNLALGVAFVWVALQRSRPATGLVPTIAAFVGVLTALSVPDLLAGRVEAGRLAGHALVVLGLILLMTHRILTRGGGDAPAEPAYRPRHRHAPGESSAPPTDDDGAPERGAGGGLKPTGRRRAA